MYLASVIHTPKWAIDEYNKIIRDFIWNDKPSKIKYATLIAPISLGGMQLQDLQSKIEANKITWIKNICNTSIKTPWKAYLQWSVQDPIQNIPLYNSRKYEELNIKDKFYNEILLSWAKLNYINPQNALEVVNQPLWRNHLIQVDHKTLKYNDWEKMGIKNIFHLIDNNGNLASEIFLKNKYGITPTPLAYNSLVHSIPAEWKKMIKTGINTIGFRDRQGCYLQIDMKCCPINEITTKDIYLHIIKKWKIKPAAGKIKWIEKYDDMNLDEDFWQYIYETPYKLTKNSKVLMTQYKIVNRILAVNYNLKIWGKSETDRCSKCNLVESIEHFIYQCPLSLALWKTIQIWWKSIFDFTIQLSVLEVLFGIPNENKDHSIDIYNYVILHAKHYIYITKIQQNDLHMFSLLLLLKKELNLTRVNFKEKSKLHKFTSKWGELYDNL
jgi:hypothetical protein